MWVDEGWEGYERVWGGGVMGWLGGLGGVDVGEDVRDEGVDDVG